jgi:hypothetical protein
MAHFNLLEAYKELKSFNFTSIDEIVQYLLSVLASKVYSPGYILKNALKINSLQAKALQRDSFTITYKSTIEKNLIEKKTILIPRVMNIQKRSIVLYFRGCTDKPHSMSVDIFHIILLYKVLQGMVENHNFKIFNDVFIVMADPLTERYEAFEKNNINIDLCVGDEFITKTCLFANTIHFTGGELPDLHAYTIPLISKYIIDYNNPHIPLNKTNYIKLNIIYPEIIFKNDGSFIYNDDLESAYRGEICSWSDLFKKVDFLKSYKIIKNITPLKFVEEVVTKLFLAEEEMLKLSIE